MRKLVELEFPSLHVLSHQDVEPDTPIQIIATIHLDYDADNDVYTDGNGGGTTA